ncbi:MAG: galactosyltransferase-related protein [Gammaproteobacteria bacterium]
MRALLGVVFKDLPRYTRALWGPGQAYLALCNRYERLEAAPDGRGYRCAWQWTSDLHAPKILPRLGRTLMRRILADYPIEFGDAPKACAAPEVSFVIGHRGRERLPNLLLTLKSIAMQRAVRSECIVVEQAVAAEVGCKLPTWVRYHYAPVDQAMAYSRAQAFNAGARLARGKLLIFNDNDLLVPIVYAERHLRLAELGFEVINLKRFIFYLSPADSRLATAQAAIPPAPTPLSVMQNAQGGGSLAITRNAFQAIGGFDEDFVGWGGEDNEFWERANTRRLYDFGYLPLVHLWHGDQPDKPLGRDAPAVKRYWQLQEQPIAARIARLRQRGNGNG